MVNPNAERRNFPAYSLSGVRALAGRGKVRYESRRVYRHVEDLQFQLDDVCRCLQTLRETDFSHSERYEDDTRWRDVYKTRFAGPDGQIHDLYVKFLLNPSCILILLNSFHPEGAL